MVFMRDILPFLALVYASFVVFYHDKPLWNLGFYFIASFMLAIFSHYVPSMLHFLGAKMPIIYDPSLIDIENIVGISYPSVIYGMEKISVLFLSPLVAIYVYLPAIMVLCAGAELNSSHWNATNNLFVQFVVATILGCGLYALIPAVGPRYFLGRSFWILPSSLPPHAVFGVVQNLAYSLSDLPAHRQLDNNGGLVPRNAMPSLHATCAILCFLALRNSTFWHQLFGGMLVLVTLITTLGLGEHYVIDWVVALPLVLLVRGITQNRSAVSMRGMVVGCCCCLLVLWIFTIRNAAFCLEFPLFIKGMVALSVLFPVALEVILRYSEKKTAGYATAD